MPTVLIVDDSPTIVAAFQHLFVKAGHEVLTATDGLSALNTARKEQPHLMVLDLLLPKLNGFEVCQMLKGDERFKSMKILMLTGKTDEQSRGIGKETGADEYLTKDCDPAHVLEVAQRLLAGQAGP